METNLDVCREILYLGDTMKEGLDHLVNRMGEGHLEDTRYLFDDILSAFQSINNALDTNYTEGTEITAASDCLQLAFDKMNQSYEDDKLDRCRMDMQFILYPAFTNWMQEVDKCLRPLIQS